MVLLAISAFILLAAFSGSVSATPLTYDAQSLANRYGTDAVNRLNNLYYEYSTRNLSDQQIKFMLSQNLFETGLFTNVANYTLMDQNNYAGLTVASGSYASYNSIADFTDAYLTFLTKGSNPLGASSLSDFNSRLQQNHYYTEDPQVYYNGLLTYYNLLS